MPSANENTLDDAIRLREAGLLAASYVMLKTQIARARRSHGHKSYEAQCAISQLGRTLLAMGRGEQASTLHWEVLAMRLELYGRRDSYTQNSAAILAGTLRTGLGDNYMAAAVECWAADPEIPRAATGDHKPLSASELQRTIRDRAAKPGLAIARLVEEYLQFQRQSTAGSAI
jgi:hypothetical protein